MIYVAVGLLLLFGAFAFVGARAIARSTGLIFDERRSVAESVSAALSREIGNIIPDVVEKMAGLSPESDRAALAAAAERAFTHLTVTDRFEFFAITSL